MVRSVSLSNSVRTRALALKNCAKSKNSISYNVMQIEPKSLELPAKLQVGAEKKQNKVYACSYDYTFCGGSFGVG